jgi:hypothetical protein
LHNCVRSRTSKLNMYLLELTDHLIKSTFIVIPIH